MVKNNFFESYISIGSNIGHSIKFIKRTIYFLHKNHYIFIKNYSNVHKTHPVHYRIQPIFYNFIIRIFTLLSPFQLINMLQYLEKKYYKKKYLCSYMPRKIDLDILIYNKYYITNKKLFLPHQYMFKRKFIKILINEVIEK